MYKRLFNFLNRFFRPDQIFKYGFNWSPMYRRTVARIKYVSRDIKTVKIEIPLSYKNVNYAGSIFGGSLFSATDPIYMVQLIQILGDDYIVWDKSASINYKKPARSKAYAIFEFNEAEIDEIITTVQRDGRLNITKQLDLTDKNGEVFAKIEKVIYISTKAYYKAKKEALEQQ